jgi:DNA-binding NtrC family response regulator
VPWRHGFHPLNLAALSPTLVESELFGHRKGAFTGALEDHVGWFESCGRHGTVFLDELAEVPADTQVKLLRVIEERTFSRLGETVVRRFEGKLIAATNRDLSAAMAAGRFRADLYYRLCADTIRTPSLQERIASAPAELETLVRHVAERVAGPGEGVPLAAEVLAWVRRRLGPDYGWPGNVRELEQCVRSILLRGEYLPPADERPHGFWERAAAGELSAEELLAGYCQQAYQRYGSYEEAGRRLGLDRRTVRARCGAGAAR